MMSRRTRNKKFTAIGEVIAKLMNENRAFSNLGIADIVRIWPKVVDEQTKNNTRPHAFDGQTLIVHVANAMWIHTLQFQKKKITGKLNHEIGQELVSAINFKIG